MGQGVRLTATHLTESFPCWPRCPTTHEPWEMLPLSNPIQKYLLTQNEHHGNLQLQEGREVSVQGNKGVVGIPTRSVQKCLGDCHLDPSFWVLKLGIMDGILLILDLQSTVCHSRSQWEELHSGASGELGEFDYFGGGTKRSWKWGERDLGSEKCTSWSVKVGGYQGMLRVGWAFGAEWH